MAALTQQVVHKNAMTKKKFENYFILFRSDFDVNAQHTFYSFIFNNFPLIYSPISYQMHEFRHSLQHTFYTGTQHRESSNPNHKHFQFLPFILLTLEIFLFFFLMSVIKGKNATKNAVCNCFLTIKNANLIFFILLINLVVV